MSVKSHTMSQLLALAGFEDGLSPEIVDLPEAIVVVPEEGRAFKQVYAAPGTDASWVEDFVQGVACKSSTSESRCFEVATPVGLRHAVVVPLPDMGQRSVGVCLPTLPESVVSDGNTPNLERWVLRSLVVALEGARDENAILRARVEQLRREEDVLYQSHANAISDAIREREQRLEEQQEHMHQLQAVHLANQMILDTAGEGICGIDRTGRLMFVNPAAARMLGYSVEEMIGKNHCEAFGCDCAGCGQSDEETSFVRQVLDDHVKRLKGSTDFRCHCGTILPVDYTCVALRDDEETVGTVVTFRDVTEQRMLEAQLRQSQKLESIGQLAAGIAHEINTPTQYIGDNTRFLGDIFGDMRNLLTASEKLRRAVAEGRSIEVDLKRFADLVAEADISYLLEEVPKAITQSLEGVGQVARIVRSMKEFSHPGSDDKQAIDLNRAIESTATVSRNEWKYVADLVTNFDPTLPLVPCVPGDLNQVFLNLIVNAAHAIADHEDHESGQKGTITISTHCRDACVEIVVTDTGTGIPEEIQPRIFDPFFTTKEVGRGTGQGLAITHSIITEKHGGRLFFNTELGVGTSFHIQIPLEG